MSSRSQRHTARIAVFLALASIFALTGCGRRGDLEPPNGAAVQTPPPKSDMSVHKANPKISPPKKEFVLDPLLQ